MAGVDYETGKKRAFQGFLLLGLITLIEVAIALVGNGHIIESITLPRYIMYPFMIGLSLYKAYFIINEFMHMKYEVKGLAMSVILPMSLLIWAVIAFMNEGGAWHDRREQIQKFDKMKVEDTKTGYLLEDYDKDAAITAVEK